MKTVMSDSSERERQIFGEALELGSLEEQRAFVKGACGDDEALRQAVEGLLEAYSQAGGFIPPRLSDPRDVPCDSTPRDGPGTIIGRYKLLEKIGEGGLGVVYMAEQQEPVRRKVALKVIKLGMDSKQVIARFEAERQALALMDHPNIAKVLDGGVIGAADSQPSTPNSQLFLGRPYFVMELVQGVPITEFCDKNHLPIAERIKLFIPVCQAIQSAHQKGIIHRDLKPTNILVTLNAGVPHPMVIDFGVAKAINQKLTEKTVFTNFAAMIGTPAYMSPEQAEMSQLDVDTRSDIYGLGVLLYELLTGTPPFPEKRLRSVGYQEMQRIIMEEEPERPSTRLRQKSVEASTSSLATSHYPLSTDLDWIVMKCLEKDRGRRYETANGLAMDLQRHLNNEPVVARPPSNLYRLQKLVRRNRLVFAAGACVLAALVIGLGLAAWQFIEKSRAYKRVVVAEGEQRRQREAAQTAQAKEAEERQRAEAEAYVADMNLAQEAWERNNVERLRMLLDQTAAYSARGFEWYYWQRQAHLELVTLRGHSDAILSVAFSPDGQRIVTGSGDRTAKVWQAATGKELVSFFGHKSYVRSVAFSPDGLRIATASDDKTAKVWDAASGQELLTLRGHGEAVFSVAFSPDGGRIVTASDDSTAKVWEATTGRELLTLTGHSNAVYSAVFSPDGRRLVTGSEDRTAKVWDAPTGKELLTLAGHGSQVSSAVFSPDGQQIVTASGDGARVWDAASGQRLVYFQVHGNDVLAVAFSPDGQRIVTGSGDRTAKVWEAATGKELFNPIWHSASINSVVFSPDGRQILTGSSDGTAKVWDAGGEMHLLRLKGHGDRIRLVAFSPDGQQIVTGSDDHTAKVWEAASGKELLTLKGHGHRVYSVAFSPNGRQIVTASKDGTTKVWDTASGKELLTLRGHNDGVMSVAFSPDGQRIVTGSDDHTAKVWDALTGKELLTLSGHNDWVKSVAFSPDGRRIATGGWDHIAKVWDAATGKELITLRRHLAPIRSVAFSPNSRQIVTGSGDQTATVWDAASGLELLTLRGHRGMVMSVAFSPDGHRIVTGSYDQSAKVWDAASGRELLTLGGHNGFIFSSVFSSDNRRIVTGSDDGTATVWQAATAEQVAAWQEQDLADQLKPAADASGRSGQWEQAAADLAAAIKHNPADEQLWLWLAAVQVQQGQIEAYLELCRKSLARFAKTTDPYTAERIAKACLLRADSGVDLATVAALADLAVTEGRQTSAMPYFQFCKGLAEYRQARFASAADWMEAVLTNRWGYPPLDTEATMVLAMAQYRSGHQEQARASLAKGSEMEEQLPRLEWLEYIIAQALSKEAKPLIGGQPGPPRQP